MGDDTNTNNQNSNNAFVRMNDGDVVGSIVVNGRTYTEADIDKMDEGEVMDLFVEQLIEDKGLENLNDKLRVEVHADLKERLIYQITRALIASLPEAEYAKLEAEMKDETATGEMINELIGSGKVDADRITQEVMMKFREVYLNNGEVKGA